VSALTLAYGRNNFDHGARHAALVEAARRSDLNTVYGRFEALRVETALLQSGNVVEGPAVDIRDLAYALTIGGVRDVFNAAGLQGGFGADVTFYATPDPLAAAYGGHPVSFHLFFRLRPKSGMMGPIWNMRMGQTMGH
jgi:hypothetical protein